MLEIAYCESFQGDRSENLDRYGHIKGDNWSFSYVLDGFEVANPHYVDSLVERIEQIKEQPKITTKENILKALAQAIDHNHEPCGKASAAFVICVDGKMTFLTVGDTRAYRLQSKTRTLDHSQAQHLINLGKAPEDTLYKHPLRKYLRKKLQNGCDISVIDISEFERAEDVLLCSDGVWSCFKHDEDIYNAIKVSGENLFQWALEHRKQNRDNMTILHLSH